MNESLAFELHALVARLDRSADRLLRDEFGMSYRRFLALFMVDQLGATTQRALATSLGISEPSVSRMTGLLAASGLLVAEPDPDGGNRHRLAVTPAGKRLVKQGRKLLGGRLAELVERSGIPAAEYLDHTKRLSALLGPEQ